MECPLKAAISCYLSEIIFWWKKNHGGQEFKAKITVSVSLHKKDIKGHLNIANSFLGII